MSWNYWPSEGWTTPEFPDGKATSKKDWDEAWAQRDEKMRELCKVYYESHMTVKEVVKRVMKRCKGSVDPSYVEKMAKEVMG